MTHPSQIRPLGAEVPGWHAPKRPAADLVLEGRYVRLVPLRADTHAALLFAAFDGHDDIWDYLPYGPFSSAAFYHRWVRDAAGKADPLFLAIYDKDQERWGGVASYLRITPEAGSIEVGHIAMAPLLQRTRAATEAMALMMAHAFEAGYRRYEWKCDALNLASRRAAQRLGLSYEGVFRQAGVVKGRNRDTAWFGAIDSEWPALSEAFRVWLDPGNFDDRGRQIERLRDLTALVRASSDPAL
ncbi:MAG: GNAT family protein [Aestuariivita sp.]|uniref:GNAT family N-acetyltransferase n=1 Tax=Aestuariivita sp. TaxID=1872407 RepID=UPI003BAE74A0